MGRAFGLVAVVSSLALVAILMALNMQGSGPTSPTAKHAESAANAAVAGLNFTGAATELEAYHAENATYAGATLPPSFGVVLVRAEERRRRREERYARGAAVVDEPQLGPGPLEAALAQLSPAGREVVALRVLLELDGPTAARILGISTTACSTRLSRALKRLEEMMSDVRV